ncbi:ABC transporter ATP-binding protein [Dinghuibacter silviterrae]|uniref:ATP-binding cassette subfamily B protein n=1 Tax=Dinghuibacter silviterrae TaxID=1539049 RepID=A0A4R8DSR9_9BACT|nr:ABC transporter ATP-binding protein [Dinghuibacter silviterrae]TDX01322.1 ATP-binding cassette subfamily B protein [Dinghuibacter silviterrae]
MKSAKTPAAPKPPGLMSLLGPYRGLMLLLLVLALGSNSVNLLLPKITAGAIDAMTAHRLQTDRVLWQFLIAVGVIFVLTFIQGLIQTYASEKVARDLRTRLSDKISRQSHAYIEQSNPARLLTNLTSDVDSVKMFVSMAVVSITSSIVIIVGASILLILINWRLACVVLTIIPLIAGSFFYILSKVRAQFKKSREVIDWLNKVINESILGSAVIRVVNSQMLEYNKFLDANSKAQEIGLKIVRLFATLIPAITFFSNMAMFTVLVMGGHFAIKGSISIGNFAAFNSYISLLIYPIIVIGFMSNIIAQATASYNRIGAVLQTPDTKDPGTRTEALRGDIGLQNVFLTYGQKPALKDVSFEVPAGSRTAVIGPTAAGKTQLLYLLTSLVKPTSGSITFDGHPIDEYQKENFHHQVGFVFQDSIMFNLSIRENIAFSNSVTDASLERALATAELKDFVEGLPDGLDTVVSERGTTLSGGQKQRIMLARALALNPKVLLLDDFTARVDTRTEKKILDNVQRNYPGLTLLSVTQKIESVEHYEQIILLMEGEVIATGTHSALLATCPEYVQIFNSQRSTHAIQSE